MSKPAFDGGDIVSDGGVLLLSTLFGQFPFLRKLFADSAYTGPIFQGAIASIMPMLAIEIVKRRDDTKGFVVEPQRWIVERTISHPHNKRRLLVRTDRSHETHEALLSVAVCMLCYRRVRSSFC